VPDIGRWGGDKKGHHNKPGLTRGDMRMQLLMMTSNNYNLLSSLDDFFM
jgi:hypothetical protein